MPNAGPLTGAAPVGAATGVDTLTGSLFYVDANGDWQPVPVANVDLNSSVSVQPGVTFDPANGPPGLPAEPPDAGDLHYVYFDDVLAIYMAAAGIWPTVPTSTVPLNAPAPWIEVTGPTALTSYRMHRVEEQPGGYTVTLPPAPVDGEYVGIASQSRDFAASGVTFDAGASIGIQNLTEQIEAGPDVVWIVYRASSNEWEWYTSDERFGQTLANAMGTPDLMPAETNGLAQVLEGFDDTFSNTIVTAEPGHTNFGELARITWSGDGTFPQRRTEQAEYLPTDSDACYEFEVLLQGPGSGSVSIRVAHPNNTSDISVDLETGAVTPSQVGSGPLPLDATSVVRGEVAYVSWRVPQTPAHEVFTVQVGDASNGYVVLGRPRRVFGKERLSPAVDATLVTASDDSGPVVIEVDQPQSANGISTISNMSLERRGTLGVLRFELGHDRDQATEYDFSALVPAGASIVGAPYPVTNNVAHEMPTEVAWTRGSDTTVIVNRADAINAVCNYWVELTFNGFPPL